RLLLMSPGALLELTMQNPSVSLSISTDFCTAELQHEICPDQSPNVKYKLTSNSQVLAEGRFSTRAISSHKYVVRIDSFYSTVFEKDAVMSSVDGRMAEFLLSFHPAKDRLFSLTLDLLLSEDDEAIPTLTKIYSDTLKIGSMSVHVSKELLSLHSEFFSNLFYGQFMERNQDVKEIKDISESEFVDFLQSLHRRRFEFVSVRSTVYSLWFADRFLMSRISARVLPYLKERPLPEELLGDTLIVADRVPNNQEIMAWILSQFPSKTKLLEVLHNILPSISSATAQMCLGLGLQHVTAVESELESERRERKRLSERMNSLVGAGDSPDSFAYFRLLCYDQAGTAVEKEDRVFCLFTAIAPGEGIANAMLWSLIPVEYVKIYLQGRSYMRGDDVFFDLSAEPTVQIKAYRS
ncbi:hypothetical protein PFISCL1PPCAC_25577, partial [Pristionchus fissidentatus]